MRCLGRPRDHRDDVGPSRWRGPPLSVVPDGRSAFHLLAPRALQSRSLRDLRRRAGRGVAERWTPPDHHRLRRRLRPRDRWRARTDRLRARWSTLRAAFRRAAARDDRRANAAGRGNRLLSGWRLLLGLAEDARLSRTGAARAAHLVRPPGEGARASRHAGTILRPRAVPRR